MTFDQCVEIVLKHEGGYVNDPNDPGGETRFGISKRAYPEENILNLTIEGAKAIYSRDYWHVMCCNDLPPMIRLIVFDCAVNQGTDFAAKNLQNIVGASQDGHIGPRTLEAISKKVPKDVFKEFAKKRMQHYASLKTFSVFGKGWSLRLFDIVLRSI